MNRDELQSLIQGTLVTTPTPFDENLNLDIGRTYEITQWWIEQGLGTNVSPLKVTAAGGECPDLTDEEWLQVLNTTVKAAGPDAVIMCGLKSKSTMHTIEDAKKAQDAGIIGLQIDLPFYHHPNQDDYVRFFTDISDAIDVGIMIYNTHWFGAPTIKPETLLRLADAEQVVAVKWSTPPNEDFDSMKQFANIFNVINNSANTVRCIQNGGRGYITSTATAYAKFDLDLWQLLNNQEYEKAQRLIDTEKPLNQWRKKSTEKSGGYRHLKAYMKAVGQDVGQPRPPTLPLEEAEISELKDAMRTIGWVKD
jgi:4-hydroxy-tetrahydrodipicolinate synthase